jgi:hypothetical protein
MSFALRSTPDPECTPEECEMLHELIVLVWAGREAERRGHAPRVARAVAVEVSEIRAAVVAVVQLEMFGEEEK